HSKNLTISTITGEKRRTTMKFKAALLSVGICLASMLTSAQTYTITDLGTLPAPYNQSSGANGLYNKGNMLDLGALPNDNESVAVGVNDGGEATGYAYSASSPFDAFLYSAGALVSLGTLGGNYSNGSAINDTDEVVGTSYTAAGAEHAFLYNGTMNDLGTLPGGTSSIAFGINGTGEVVGTSSTGSGTLPYAFLYNNGVMQNL